LFYENIIITGTSRGIGFELALQFAKAGHQVLAISRNILKALLSNENISLSVDLSNESELNKVNEFHKSWKQVDAVIHNAGSLLLKPL
jgi:NADP-dependent 3-hydroxy acid dehydrogenase YdfG